MVDRIGPLKAECRARSPSAAPMSTTEIAAAIGYVTMPSGPPLERWCGADHTAENRGFDRSIRRL